MSANPATNSATDSASSDLDAAPTPLDPVFIPLTVSDPEVIAALSECRSSNERHDLATTWMKIGMLSLKAARGTVDGQTVRNEGERLLTGLSTLFNSTGASLLGSVQSELGRHFDPNSGAFAVRMERLVKDDGEIATLVQRQVAAAQTNLAKTLDELVGPDSSFLKMLSPDQSNAFMQAVKGMMDDVLKQESAAIVNQFSLDNKEGALARLLSELTVTHGDLTTALKTDMEAVVAEFSLDKPDSALSRLVGRVESTQKTLSSQFSLDDETSALSRIRSEMLGQLKDMSDNQTQFRVDVMEAITRLDTQRKERLKSTLHGMEFEDSLRSAIESLGKDPSDVLDATGNTTGVIKNCKVGDYVLTLSPDSVAAGARIVIEAKQDASYTQSKTLEECDEARRNRDAAICLFVHSKRTAPTGYDSMHRYGRDVVVVWDPEDGQTDVILKAGLMVAKALSVKAAQLSKREAVSYTAIDSAIEVIRKSVTGFDEILTSANTIQSANDKIRGRVAIMQKNIGGEIEKLADEIASLKSSGPAASVEAAS